jgi:hypothetical protein
MENKQELLFIRKFFTFLFTIFLSIAALNLLVDPYGIYNLVKKDGFNFNKPAIKSHLRMSKAYSVRYIKPKSIILGTSRAEFGLDPDHIGFVFLPTYNLNLSGGNSYEMLRYFQHVNAVNEIKQVILALDFFQFDVNNLNSPDFSESRLATDKFGNLSSQSMPLNDIFDSLFSLDALTDSFDTLISQSSKPIYLSNGLIDPTTLRRVKMMDITGQRQLFLNNEERYLRKTYQDFSLELPKKNLSSLENYRHLLSIAYEKGMDLKIIINPVHARQLETISQSGLWEKFEDWKYQLVRINEKEARLYTKQAFPIWDFSGFNHYTTERVPFLDDKTSRMSWYWESSHFTKELGDKVLDQVLLNNFDKKESNHFGILINSKNIVLHNRSIRESQKLWRDKNFKDVKEIENLSRIKIDS